MKRCIFFMLLCLTCTMTFAENEKKEDERIVLVPKKEYGDFDMGSSRSLTPVLYIQMNGHELIFDGSFECDAVRLLQDDVVLFAETVEKGQTTLVLPVHFTGEYELQIVVGDTTFYGYIQL